MRAAVLRGGAIVVVEVPDPIPGPGQLLCGVRACGICGSDLHAIEHGDVIPRSFADRPRSEPPRRLEVEVADFHRDVILGHEFCAEVLDCGPDVDGFAPGDLVVSPPTLIEPGSAHGLGWSNVHPGGFAERMVLTADLASVVPNGLDPHLAALTEPTAVTEHALAKIPTLQGCGALVIGAGPVGLTIVASLRSRGVAPIVVSERVPARRALAGVLGAHSTVDPEVDEPIAEWHRLAARRQRLVIVDAVGAPGVIDHAIRMAPPGAELLVVGICCDRDAFSPLHAFRTELTVRFSAIYTGVEFASTLRAIAEGQIDVSPILTGAVSIDGVAGACARLRSTGDHAKIVVDPRLAGTDVVMRR